MSKLMPRAVPPEMWKQMSPNKAYAIRANTDDDIHLQFGKGGLFISITTAPNGIGRLVNSVTLEEGNMTVLGKITSNETAIMGRSTDCTVKAIHPVMSRQHLELKLDGNVLIAKDLGSTNGTFYLAENNVFDIEDYIAAHPLDKASTTTLDSIHEAFGPTIDDFLKRYIESKKQ